MAFNVNVLGPRIGAEIAGWNAGTASHSEIEDLKALLASRGVLALRDQKLSPAQLMAALAQTQTGDFGGLIIPRITTISASRRQRCGGLAAVWIADER